MERRFSPQGSAFCFRGQRVILDSDAARRNADRFPADFVFRLNLHEATDLRSQIVTSSGEGEWPRISTAGNFEENRSQFVTGSQKHRDSRFRPFVFTEFRRVQVALKVRGKQERR